MDCHNLRSKETGKEVANQTANSVDSKDIQSIVNAEQELQLGGIVAGNGTDHTKDEGSPRSNKARAGGNSDQTGNNTRAETDSGPLALQTVVEQTPGNTADRGSKVGYNGSHDSTQVSRQRRASVEAEPSNPEEDGSNNDMSDVVGTVVELVSAVPTTLAQHQGVSQCSRTGSNMHGSTTSKVETTQLEDPTGRIPGPASNGVVDNGGPDEHEDDARQHAATLSNGTNGEGNTISSQWPIPSNSSFQLIVYSRNRSEHALEDGEEKIRDLGAADGGRGQDILETKVRQITDELSTRVEKAKE